MPKLAFGAMMEICPKCGKPAYSPYVMEVVKKYGQRYRYKVYRHPDGRRRTPRKCTVRETESVAPVQLSGGTTHQ